MAHNSGHAGLYRPVNPDVAALVAREMKLLTLVDLYERYVVKSDFPPEVLKDVRRLRKDLGL